MMCYYDLNNPSVGNVTTWQIPSCGGANPPCDYPGYYDSHMAWWHDGADDDLGPICGSIYNVTTLAPPPVEPWQGEEVCISSTPSWTVGSTIGMWQVWRFTHSFNTGGNPFLIHSSLSANCRTTDIFWRSVRTGVVLWARLREGHRVGRVGFADLRG